jgi:hypothetical protein
LEFIAAELNMHQITAESGAHHPFQPFRSDNGNGWHTYQL